MKDTKAEARLKPKPPQKRAVPQISAEAEKATLDPKNIVSNCRTSLGSILRFEERALRRQDDETYYGNLETARRRHRGRLHNRIIIIKARENRRPVAAVFNDLVPLLPTLKSLCKLLLVRPQGQFTIDAAKDVLFGLSDESEKKTSIGTCLAVFEFGYSKVNEGTKFWMEGQSPYKDQWGNWAVSADEQASISILQNASEAAKKIADGKGDAEHEKLIRRLIELLSPCSPAAVETAPEPAPAAPPLALHQHLEAKHEYEPNSSCMTNLDPPAPDTSSWPGFSEIRDKWHMVDYELSRLIKAGDVSADRKGKGMRFDPVSILKYEREHPDVLKKSAQPPQPVLKAKMKFKMCTCGETVSVIPPASPKCPKCGKTDGFTKL